MSIITCRKCGAKVSDQYSYCTNCQAPLHEGLRSRGSKHKLPSEARQGALVGAFVGLIYGIGNAIYFYFLILPFIWSTVTARIVESPKALVLLPTVWNIVVAVDVVVVPIIGVIMGTILSVLFVVLRKKLPGRTIIRKSVVFSLILLAIVFLIGLLLGYLSPSRANILNETTSASFISIQVVAYALALVQFPLLGCLFGYLLDRKLKPK